MFDIVGIFNTFSTGVEKLPSSIGEEGPQSQKSTGLYSYIESYFYGNSSSTSLEGRVQAKKTEPGQQIREAGESAGKSFQELDQLVESGLSSGFDFFIDVLRKNKIEGSPLSLLSELFLGLLQDRSIEEETCIKFLQSIAKKGLGNLFEAVKKNSNSISGYEQQSPLVNVIAFLSQKIVTNLEKRSKLEKEIKDLENDQRVLLRKFFPEVLLEPKINILKGYPETFNFGQAIERLFPDSFDSFLDPKNFDKNPKDIKKLLNSAQIISQKKEELADFWKTTADDLLKCFFPDRLKDISIPWIFAPLKLVNLYAIMQDYLAYGLELGYKIIDIDQTKKQVLSTKIQQKFPENGDWLCTQPAQLAKTTILSFFKNERNKPIFKSLLQNHLPDEVIDLAWVTLYQLFESQNKALDAIVTCCFGRMDLLFVDILAASTKQLGFFKKVGTTYSAQQMSTVFLNGILWTFLHDDNNLFPLFISNLLDSLSIPSEVLPQVRLFVLHKLFSDREDGMGGWTKPSLFEETRQKLFPLRSLDDLDSLEAELNQKSGSTFLSSLAGWLSKNLFTRVLPHFRNPLISSEEIAKFIKPLVPFIPGPKREEYLAIIQNGTILYAENSGFVEQHIKSIALQFFTIMLSQVSSEHEEVVLPPAIVQRCFKNFREYLESSEDDNPFILYSQPFKDKLPQLTSTFLNIPGVTITDTNLSYIQLPSQISSGIFEQAKIINSKIDNIFPDFGHFIAGKLYEIGRKRNFGDIFDYSKVRREKDYQALDDMLQYVLNYVTDILAKPDELGANFVISLLDNLFDSFFYKGGIDNNNLNGSSNVGLFRIEINRLFTTLKGDFSKKPKLIRKIVDLSFIFSNQIAEKLILHEGGDLPKRIAEVALEVLGKHFETIGQISGNLQTRQISYKNFIEASQRKGDLHTATLDPNNSPKYLDVINGLLECLNIPRGEVEGRDHPAFLGKVGALQNAIHELAKQEGLGKKVLQANDFLDAVTTFCASIGKELSDEDEDEDEDNVLKLFETQYKGMIREQYHQYSVQQKNEIYIPMAKALMKALFPAGEENLSFIPAGMRNIVWNALENLLIPQLLPFATSTIFHPEIMSKLLHNLLYVTNSGLKGQARYEPLDQVQWPENIKTLTAKLVEQLIQFGDLPPVIKNQIVDKDGKLNPYMLDMILNNLHHFLKPESLHSYIPQLIDLITKRDKNGNFMFKFDPNAPPRTAEQILQSTKKIEDQIQAELQNLMVNSISYYLRSQWARLQYHIDQVCTKIPGMPILKKGLDILFRLVFFTLIGSVLSILMTPVVFVVKKIMAKYLSLEKNQEQILKLFTRVSEDQPRQADYPLFQENLLFNLFQKISEVCHTEQPQAV